MGEKFRRVNKNHLEDNFDIDEYIANCEREKFQKRYVKNKKVINLISVLIVFFSVVLVFLFYQLVNYYVDLTKSDKLAKENVVEIQTSGNSLMLPREKKDIILKMQEQEKNIEQPAIDDTEINVNKPEPEKQVSETFQGLIQKYNNTDIVGFVSIEATQINNIVVQGTDNDFYLSHDVNKEANKAGSVFMDHENDINNFSKNTVLYGHNMRNKTMFHNIRYYAEESFYRAHRYIDFSTLYENTKWEIFAFYSTNIEFDYIRTNFESEADYQNFIDEITSRSFYVADNQVTTDDYILTLSTCTNQEEDTRYVVHARLISRD